MSYVDSICIKFLNPSLVIYGRGNNLFIQNENIKENLQLKTYDKIHKISFLDCGDGIYDIVCSAGRDILLTRVVNNKFQGPGLLTRFNDWISSIQYLKDGIAIITRHNIAALLKIENDKLIVQKKLKCDDNSTLYCSFIHGNVWEDLIFFSGTALGELIIWKKDEASEDAKTLYQKSTHNGVIFSISYNEDFHGIVTASDDRSIKVYRPNDSFTDLKELWQLFGHTSRVFVGKIIKYKDETKFISAGEDSNICLWTENGMLQSKKNISASGGIWDLDYDPKNARIVTSSSTGKLNQFILDKIFYEIHTEEVISTCENVEPSKLAYLENGTLCVIDSITQIYTKNSTKKEWIKEDIPSFSQKIVAMDVYENRLFLATKDSVLIFDYSNVCEKLNFTFELNVDEKFPLQQESNYIRAIHVLNRNEIFLSDVYGSCMVVNVESKVVKNLFKIPKSIEPWTTSVGKIDDYWIIADRIGSLFLYRNEENDLSTFQMPIQKLSKLHGKTGVTTIRPINNDFIKTTGNDGTIKTLHLNRKTSQLEFCHLERTHVHFIEKILEYGDESYVYGFNDNFFVVYKDREIIYEHKCGGRHRHWDVTLINKDDCKVQFAYIYKKQVHCVEFYLNNFNFDTPYNNKSDIIWHAKPCNVLKVIDDSGILISGGEDTILKFTKIEMMKDGNVLYKKIADINSHISSIKAIVTWRENDEEKGDDLNIISMGGRAQIVMTKVIKMKYVKEEINFMLTNSMLCGNSKQSTFDTETRFTCAFYDVKRKHLFVGCSDGYLRVFKLQYNEFSSSLKPFIESFYGKCILHITMIKSFILTMATDGIVCFWYFNEMQEEVEQGQKINQLNIIHKLQHNRNGINCFDIFTIDDNHYKIATSGDDTGLHVTEFEIVDNSLKCYKTINSYGIHIAQVTGIKFITADKLLTVSVDQTLCKVEIKSDNFTIIDKKFTCISDVKGFSLFDKKFIFVHGAGLEAINYF
ncbi:tRNA (34-2'-O)-methyltransferase regulator WDR6 [Chironomus tepperi]|uniref:tRNA (34-2'-O)-methyltransferase regulator WDR6 n=1 Tax=Chironomus tepperi TaxID=113505 RepID=UPI00391F9CCA